MEFNHKSVLLEECIDGLNIKKNGIYVDGTMGGAGHSKEIIKNIDRDGLLLGIDRDEEAISVAKERLKNFANVKFIHDNHDNIKNIIENQGFSGVDGILLDLGVSSYQLDERNRGFSYIGNGDLDMRMDRTQKLTAKTVVNEYKEEDLARIIFEYGEEKFSKQIAKKIVEARKQKPIETTDELVKIIEGVVHYKKGEGHPAKRTFQAIRIEVNDEIKPLYNTIIDSIDCLNPGGRLCVITFHSLEDRAVKNAFTDSTGVCTCPPGLPYCVCGAEERKKGIIITKKPILPSEEEMRENPRSKSAKLRIFERI